MTGETKVIHDVLIVDGSAYSAGPRNASRPADLNNPMHYPVTAVCSVCSKPVRREKRAQGQLDWMHTEVPAAVEQDHLGDDQDHLR